MYFVDCVKPTASTQLNSIDSSDLTELHGKGRLGLRINLRLVNENCLHDQNVTHDRVFYFVDPWRLKCSVCVFTAQSSALCVRTQMYLPHYLGEMSWWRTLRTRGEFLEAARRVVRQCFGWDFFQYGFNLPRSALTNNGIHLALARGF